MKTTGVKDFIWLASLTVFTFEELSTYIHIRLLPKYYVFHRFDIIQWILLFHTCYMHRLMCLNATLTYPWWYQHTFFYKGHIPLFTSNPYLQGSLLSSFVLCFPPTFFRSFGGNPRRLRNHPEWTKPALFRSSWHPENMKETWKKNAFYTSCSYNFCQRKSATLIHIMCLGIKWTRILHDTLNITAFEF